MHVSFFVASIVRQPDEAFQASLQGLSIWWNLVFPGLLPFLVLAELMAAYGVVQALGVLLEPAMRRLFRLPGEAGFAVAAGWTMGSPAGAEATAALRRRAALSRDEGERLLALSHMPNPVFMLVVVGAGFLRRPELGLAAPRPYGAPPWRWRSRRRMCAVRAGSRPAPPLRRRPPSPAGRGRKTAAAAERPEFRAGVPLRGGCLAAPRARWPTAGARTAEASGRRWETR
ncbi:hypothetical protein PACILC2_32970 [Paenibacillus cisolokensis]|uniref:Nucleoside transporter/FeoB GTPase Gate domain-containing protein n=1 Tax=Paenibacillus cisolokensis TaxID=1658519 RepID=A0ABQ4N9U3_9BACL|nr:nucleoside recognition domain-containing protein [Paenibacillus cisolokensis]GIQ64729.1 hypothetical protein PACILC2_32970 [Paenibacillus cisolokensis]